MLSCDESLDALVADESLDEPPPKRPRPVSDRDEVPERLDHVADDLDAIDAEDDGPTI